MQLCLGEFKMGRNSVHAWKHENNTGLSLWKVYRQTDHGQQVNRITRMQFKFRSALK